MKRFICPSKVNIVLKVLNKREDGYHNLWSIFLPLKNPYDVMEIFDTPEKGFKLECNLKEIEKNNILHKVYEKFGEETGLWPGIFVNLTKGIPIGSGLGGGSSDAACLLKYLGNFLEAGQRENIIFNVAKKCGADIPFFLKNSPCIVEGIGDKLKEIKIDFTGFNLLVLCPDLDISTKWAYGELDRKRDNHYRLTSSIFDIKYILHLAPMVWTNDFEEVVFFKYKELLGIKALCYRMGARSAVLSGTGSAIVALFSGLDSLDMLKQICRQRGVKVFVN